MSEGSHKRLTCASCEARIANPFGYCTDSEVEGIDKDKSCNIYKKNQAIFTEGSYPRGVFCINRGKAKIFARGDGGKEQIIHIAKEGEFIGFRAMLSEEPYRVSASALEDCAICFILKNDFVKLIDSNTEFRDTIIRDLSRELGDRAVFITSLAQKSVRERLAISLLVLNKIYAPDYINLTREDLANFVGTATETLIRLLKEFKEESLVRNYGRKLEIIDLEGLERIAGK